MQYRKMPKIDLQLSALGFGCMRFATSATGGIDKIRTKAQLRHAIDNGLNYLDTAYIYHMGASEKFLGEHVLTDGYREKVYIADKLPCMIINKKEQIEKYFVKQLQRLQTDCIDFYLLHALNGSLWARMKDFGILSYMDELKRSGRIKYMGFSFHGALEDFRQICDEYDWDFVQVQYNLLDEHFQAGAEGIDYAATKGYGVVVMEPLRGGILVGQIPKPVQEIWDTAKVKRTPADWALRWILNNPNVHVVLSGMNEEAHIEENMQVANTALPNALTQDELSIIKQVKETYGKLLQVGCTGCRYCLPCPVGIDIPAAFHALNNLHLFGNIMALYDYAAVTGFNNDPAWTNKCIDCGKCEEACPQSVAVRKEFKKVQKYIENPVVKGIIYIISVFWTGGRKVRKRLFKD